MVVTIEQIQNALRQERLNYGIPNYPRVAGLLGISIIDVHEIMEQEAVKQGIPFARLEEEIIDG